MTDKIRKLEAEGFAIYTTLTALAMRDPYSAEVRDGMRKLAKIKRKIERLEEAA